MELPFKGAAACIQGIDTAIAAAEIYRSVPHRRGRKIAIKGIGHGFSGGLGAVKMLAGKSPFSFGLKLPLQLSSRRIHRIKAAAVSSEIDGSMVHRRGSSCPHAQGKFPFLGSRFEIDSVESAVGAGDIGGAIDHCRRRDNLTASL